MYCMVSTHPPPPLPQVWCTSTKSHLNLRCGCTVHRLPGWSKFTTASPTHRPGL
ncbi:hypothetical protein JB92DRAFT_2953563 [Gautieria morchelliformis]|nr:hypothetical protein JB92DRAFT_2953563 [Gautieria morchelliformis]